MDGFVELTKEKLVEGNGIFELNRMLQLLFETVAGDGVRQKVYSGIGSPESSVVADIGSLYMRLDGGASTSLYVKESGVQTDTGWVAK